MLRVLFILIVFCNVGFGLRCYSCLDPVSYCNSTTECSSYLDACAIVVSGPRRYHQCWKFIDCNFEFFSKTLGENELEYRCCQKSLCNLDLKPSEKEKEKDKQKGEAVAVSGEETMLLVTLGLVTSWNYFP